MADFAIAMRDGLDIPFASRHDRPVHLLPRTRGRIMVSTLVLLPGLDGTGRLFGDFVGSLGSGFEIVVVAYPTDRPLGYRELEEIVRSFLPVNRPYFLLVESFSGPLALSIASSAPIGLQGLVLCASFARNPLPFFAVVKPLLRLVSVAALPPALLGFFVLGRFSTPALLAALMQTLAAVSPDALRARIRAVLSVDVADLLQDIRLPMLYLRAVEDRVVPRASSELIVLRAPKATVVDLPAPHFMLQVSPSAAASAVTRFIAAVGASLT